MDCEKACDGNDNSYEGRKLAEEYNNLDLNESRQTLVQHGIMTPDGTLTRKGEVFMFNYLARENEADLAAAVKKVEAARPQPTSK